MCREEFLKYQLECSREAVDSRSGHRLTETELKRLQAAQLASDKTVFQVGVWSHVTIT